MAAVPAYPGTPRWVKVTAIVVVAVALLAAMVIFVDVGAHGPGRHGGGLSSGADSSSPWGPLSVLGILVVSALALCWDWLADKGFVPARLGEIRRGLSSPGAPTMSPRLRRFVLAAHVTSSVGSLGAVAVFLAFAVAGLASQDAQLVRAAYIAMDLTARLIIAPLLLASLFIGLVQALGSPWGLFRHYWVLGKFLLTVFTIVVLLNQMEGIRIVAAVATDAPLSGADLLGLRRSLWNHAAGGLVVLVTLVALSIYKPQGMTRYGWFKQHEQCG